MIKNEYKNNAITQLATAITTAGQTTFDVVTPSILFTGATADNPFYLRVKSGSSLEYMLVTDITGNTLTVTRAQDGTTGQTFAIGAEALMSINKAHFDNIEQMYGPYTIPALDVDGSKGGLQVKSISSPETFTFSNLRQGQNIRLEITSTSNAVLTLPASVTVVLGAFSINARNIIEIYVNDSTTEQTAKITNVPISESIGLITGIIHGMAVTVNGGDPAKFDVSAGRGVIIDFAIPTSPPVITFIEFAGLTAEPVTGIASGIFTSLYIDVNGDVQQALDTVLSSQQIKQNIVLDAVVHNDLTTITNVATNSVQAYQGVSALFDYVRKLGPINEGNTFNSSISGDLTIQKTVGSTTLPWINRDVDPQNPAEATNPSQNPVIAGDWTAFYQDGVGGFTPIINKTTVDPDFWDDGTGTLNGVTNNRFTIKRFYFFGQNDKILTTYGQAEYTSLVLAESAIFSESPVLSPLLATGSFVSALIIQEGVTDLDSAIASGDAKFVTITSETSSAGGSAGAQDFQNTYDLSVTPQITTDSTGGALTIKRGSSADTDDILEGQNGAGTKTFAVTGEGALTANGATITKVSATVATLNRTGSVGKIIQLEDDGTEVGYLISIGGASSAYVGDPRSGGTGYGSTIGAGFLTDENGNITNNTRDFGLASFQIKDIHLGGNIIGLSNSFTPTFINLTLGNGTVWGEYQIIDKVCHIQCGVIMGSTSVVTGNLGVSGLPATSFTQSNTLYPMPIMILDAGATHYQGVALVTANATSTGVIKDSSNNIVTATSPMTWAVNDILQINGSYPLN